MRRVRTREIVLGVLLGLLVLQFYRSNRKEPKDVNAVDRVVLTASAPLERASIVLFDAWMRVWQRYRYRIALKRENERLARKNAQLAAENRYLAAVAARGRQLARFQAYLKDSTAEMLPANVVRRRIDSTRFRVIGIVIDRRYPDVACGAPVVTPRGVVGRVLYFELPGGARLPCPVETSLKKRRYRRIVKGDRRRIGRALVQLTVDPRSSLDVRAPRTGARGILRGLGWDRGFVARLHDLGSNAKVRPGDLLVTTGVDGRFPRDLPVGRVLSVTPRKGQEPMVLVRPIVDFGKLSRVLVVVSPPPPPIVVPRRRSRARLGLVPYP